MHWTPKLTFSESISIWRQMQNCFLHLNVYYWLWIPTRIHPISTAWTGWTPKLPISIIVTTCTLDTLCATTNIRRGSTNYRASSAGCWSLIYQDSFLIWSSGIVEGKGPLFNSAALLLQHGHYSQSNSCKHWIADSASPFSLTYLHYHLIDSVGNRM